MMYRQKMEVLMRQLQNQRQRRLLIVDEDEGPELPREVREPCRELLAQLLVQVTNLAKKERTKDVREDSTESS
jgi:hypothetical protein